ncbi:hypothetical protein EVAR_6360_1 [Eumeta japonica]|uniref:Uncharacterized protein n=1 Tax=Eumeta variegata TaxID=151549 RepID=A0A4C1TFI7_EUMVA|nr:hypothetical protein EVAR_6360_1 [Eumeta japonica]
MPPLQKVKALLERKCFSKARADETSFRQKAHPQKNGDSHIYQGARSVKKNREMRTQPPHVKRCHAIRQRVTKASLAAATNQPPLDTLV